MESPVFVREVDNKLVWTLVHKTQLPFSTVRSLLLRGWSYKEEIDLIPAWLAPIAMMKKEKDDTTKSCQL